MNREINPAAVVLVGFLATLLLMSLVALGAVCERVALAHQCTQLGKFANYNHVFLCVQGPDVQL